MSADCPFSAMQLLFDRSNDQQFRRNSPMTFIILEHIRNFQN